MSQQPTLNVYNTLETPVRWRTGVPGLSLTAGLPNIITLNLKNSPIAHSGDLSNISSFVITLRDIPDISRVVYKFADIAVDCKGSDVELALPIPAKFPRGYYRLHIVAYDGNKAPAGVYQSWVVVDSSIDPQQDDHMEATSVRTQFADMCEDDNKLLDGLEIGCGDICEAVERCLQQWAATAPRTSIYTGRSFPYPELLRNGVMSMLLKTICTALDRNAGTYVGEGLQVTLEARVTSYKALQQEYNALWRAGMMQMKNEENVACFNGGLVYE